VAIDLSAAYACAVRQALPRPTIVVDQFHLDRVANDMLTKVGRRVAWDNRDRRSRRRRLVEPRMGQPAPAADRQGTPLPAAVRHDVERGVRR
jgi:transposase